MSKNRKYQPSLSAARIRAAGIAVFVLALMQISVASHQFEHAAEDMSNACRVCAQQDRFDSTLGVAIESKVRYVVYSLPTEIYASRQILVRLRPFNSRAPPLS